MSHALTLLASVQSGMKTAFRLCPITRTPTHPARDRQENRNPSVARRINPSSASAAGTDAMRADPQPDVAPQQTIECTPGFAAGRL